MDLSRELRLQSLHELELSNSQSTSSLVFDAIDKSSKRIFFVEIETQPVNEVRMFCRSVFREEISIRLGQDLLRSRNMYKRPTHNIR